MEIAILLIPVIAALLVLTYYLAALLIRKLAERNLFWTFVEEGTAKAIVINGRFTFCVMSFSGHMFAADGPNPPAIQADGWDIVTSDDSVLHRRYLPLLRNVRWIGLPPFNDAYVYGFSWTSLEEEQKDEKDMKKKFHYSDKTIDYILIQDDIYVTQVKEAECKDNIPLDAIILIGGRIVNPYKALFKVERWLESTANRVGADMRDLFGKKTYAQIRELSDTEANVSEKKTFDEVLKEWGFEILFVRVHSVNPGSDLAAEFIRATTVTYIAEETAKANEAEGRGKATRDKQHFEAVTGVTGGLEMFKWNKIAESKLTTYVEGGAAKPVVTVGGQPTTT